MTNKQQKNEILEEALEILEETPEEKPAKTEVESCLSREEELISQIQRLQAEFENFQKRTEKEKSQIKETANSTLIQNLLPLLDNFSLSLKHNSDPGVQMIYDTLLKTLENEGLKKIDTSIPFDPKFHEALLQEEGNKDGKILEELQTGYTLNGRLLRASKVKISKKS